MKRLAAALLLSAPLSILAMPAFAQAPMPPAPPALAPEKSIPMDQALAAAQAALDTCLANKSAATVEIVDLNGLTKVVLSADGARPNSFDYARMKAYTVLKKGMSSADFGKVAKLVPGQPIEGDPQLIQYGGAQPIKKNGVMIGTISVSGPTGAVADDACAMAGLAKFHF